MGRLWILHIFCDVAFPLLWQKIHLLAHKIISFHLLQYFYNMFFFFLNNILYLWLKWLVHSSREPHSCIVLYFSHISAVLCCAGTKVERWGVQSGVELLRISLWCNCSAVKGSLMKDQHWVGSVRQGSVVKCLTHLLRVNIHLCYFGKCLNFVFSCRLYVAWSWLLVCFSSNK